MYTFTLSGLQFWMVALFNHIIKCVLGFCLFSFQVERVEIKDFVPPFSELKISINNFYKRVLNYKDIERREERKWLIFKLLPVLGLDFFDNRVSLKFRSSGLVNSIDILSEMSPFFKVTISYQEAVCELTKLYSNIIEEIELYNSYVEAFIFVEKQKDLYIEKYKNYKVTPSDYFLFMESYQNKLTVLHEKYLKIVKLKNELICFSKVETHNNRDVK
jgi:hypothetical protein